MNTHPLPNTNSIQELAHFWDTHDVTDYECDLMEVEEQVFGSRTVIPVALDSSEANFVREIAKQRGVPESEPIQGWVREKIVAR